MEILVIVAVVLLIGHVIFHPLRTLGCLVEAFVGGLLLLVALGALGDLLLIHR
ncbi:hypothetical protein SAMN02745225_01726 [Ferrithrix thermotolerans DSM 19514]|jgi:hypothetical protein|uniref:Uncharacterized protein n=1 Tax=Ferrithrix thermotolerans DSM 19514 TaxID=1121881 RepID=A0A1M4WN61_9ACTN|nr:hypothetical protein [Ferrithrix thermotolerans]SHE82658.1 hypothetical protein SAMN02745225_01726 [Ferrithrix thermotolerans DSM 19514]